MKRNRSWIVIAAVALIVIRGFALPSSRTGYYAPDWDVDDTDFVGWSVDSIRHFVDSLLDSPIDSEAIEYIYQDVPDSIQSVFDSVKRAVFIKDSTEKAKIAFQRWFDSIPRKEQKKWLQENVILPMQLHKMDSIIALKDSLKAIRDSIIENTPRILQTPFLPDSLYYKRLLLMSRDMKFGDIKMEKFDTSYNYHYYDYPFFHQDVNATWLGTAGAPVQLYNVYKRTEEENATFFTPYQSWTYTPSTLPMYNTKTPYTELAYWGTLFSGKTKEEINARIMTTQNITPELNITFEVNKFGGNGMIQREHTDATHMALSANYLGKKYSAFGGWIHSKIVRQESGGISDPAWIRDTTVKSLEVDVILKNAQNTINRNTLFLNHHLRIPFGSDSLTTAFVGHSLDFSTYKKYYTDQISDATGKNFYHNTFIKTPGKSDDTLAVSKFDNKLYLRLQPWKDNAIVSKIDVGVGDKLVTYHDVWQKPDSTGMQIISSGKTRQNNIYAYAGIRGMFREYFNWNADGKVYFAGYQVGNFDVNAHLGFNFYPFRRARKSPVAIGVDFHTDLTTPDHYESRILANHYKWDESFKMKSTTKIGGSVDIPYWKLHLDAGYSMLGNTLYYDNEGIARQSGEVVSVISANLRKEFVIWWFHLDNNILFQYSSNQNVMPVPMLALNLRYYLQFNVVKGVMQMQIGAQCLYNTPWRMPSYNPNLGVFFNQSQYTFGNCPYIDVFANIQWKRACIFIKGENINQGGPMKKGMDYFTATSYIHTQRTLKLGILWPFYIQPKHAHSHDHDHGGASKR